MSGRRGRGRVWDLKHIAFGGVDDHRLAAGAHPGQLCIVVQVHMPVHEPLRLKLIQQRVEALKAFVGVVGVVVQTAAGEWVNSRSMPPALWALRRSLRTRPLISFSVYW